jgi:hypothetical protein
MVKRARPDLIWHRRSLTVLEADSKRKREEYHTRREMITNLAASIKQLEVSR